LSLSGSGESAKVIQDLEMNLKDALAYIEQEKLQSQELLSKLQSQELRANQLCVALLSSPSRLHKEIFIHLFSLSP